MVIKMNVLQLRQRIIRSMIRTSDRTKNIRRPEKYIYRDYLNDAYMRMLRLCIKANRQRGEVRKKLQYELDTELEVIKGLVDIAASPEDPVISVGLHEIWSKELSEIGRMIGGWIKSDAGK